MSINELIKFVFQKYGLKFEPAIANSKNLFLLSSPVDGTYFAMLSRIIESDRVINALDLRCGNFSEVIRDLPGYSMPFRVRENDWVGIWLDKVDRSSVEKTFDYAFKLVMNDENSAINQQPYLYIPEDKVDPKYQEQRIPKKKTIKELGEAIPGEIKKMRQAYDYTVFSGGGRYKNFVIQGQLMEDYQDDYHKVVSFKRYYPTFHDMTVPQLRTYFTWRTKIRQRKFEKIDTSYVFVYIYELSNNLGCSDSHDGLMKLLDFKNNYVDLLDPEINKYLEVWLKDYLIYYQLAEYQDLIFAEEIKEDTQYEILLTPENYSDEKVFEELKTLSPYLAKCQLVAKLDDAFPKVIKLVWQQLVASKNFLNKYVAKKNSTQRELFAGAVFYQKDKNHKSKYKLSQTRKYIVDDGNIIIQSYLPISRQQAELNTVFHEVDRLARHYFQIGRSLKPRKLEFEYLDAIKQGILTAKYEIAEAKKPKIEIDFTNLEQIRADASSTRESLLTEEEKELENSENEDDILQSTHTEEKIDFEEQNSSIKNDFGLTSDEAFFLQALLKKQPWKEYLENHQLMGSILADSINEKMFDEIGDNVIEFDNAEQPIIIEDYQSDLEDLVFRRG